MSRLSRLALLAVGLALAVFVIWQSGPAALWAGVRATWWVIPIVVLLWGAAYLGNTIAWRLLVPTDAPPIPLHVAYAFTVSGFAVNYATPLASFGGEPVKAALASSIIGGPRATGSVIAFRVLHSVSHLLINLMAIIPAFVLFPRTPPVWLGFGILAIGLGASVWYLLGRHRDGVLVDLVTLIGRLPVIGRLVRPLLPSVVHLEELDRHFTDTYRQRPAAFRRALAVEMVARMLSMAEFVFILWAQGGGFRPFAALAIGAFSSLIVNMMAFVPFELGTREAGLYGLFGALGLDPVMGTQAAVLTRVRELIWMIIGLALLVAIRPAKAPPGGQPPHPS